MQLNLSAEMIYALYRASCDSERKAWNNDKTQFDLMREFQELVKSIADESELKTVRKWIVK